MRTTRPGYWIDHHLHTTRHSPDSVMTPTELIERANRLGLNGVVITEHDALWDPDELADLNERAGEDVTVLAGVEISAREGHFLVYGLTDLDETPVGVPLNRLIEVVRESGAAIVAAHPFRWDQPFERIVDQIGPAFDGIELVSKNITLETRGKAERLLEQFPMARSGSSDAHAPEELGCYFSIFAEPIETMADFVRGLRSGRFEPGHFPGATGLAGSVESTRA